MFDMDKLASLFARYHAGFYQQDVDAVIGCYATPCTLTTPEELKFIANEYKLQQTITEIFQQLNNANVSNIHIVKGSVERLNTNLAVVCIHWQFVDSNQQVFAEFCAFYHVEFSDSDEGKIRHVISHELTEYKQFHSNLILKTMNGKNE